MEMIASDLLKFSLESSIRKFFRVVRSNKGTSLQPSETVQTPEKCASFLTSLFDNLSTDLSNHQTMTQCDGTGFSTTFLPYVVPYSCLYMWLRVLLTSRSLLAYLATLCMQSFTPLQAHPPSFRCKLNYLSTSSSSFGLHQMDTFFRFRQLRRVEMMVAAKSPATKS